MKDDLVMKVMYLIAILIGLFWVAVLIGFIGLIVWGLKAVL